MKSDLTFLTVGFPSRLRGHDYEGEGGEDVRQSLYMSIQCGLTGGSGIKKPPISAGDAGSIPDLGRSPGEGNGNPI